MFIQDSITDAAHRIGNNRPAVVDHFFVRFLTDSLYIIGHEELNQEAEDKIWEMVEDTLRLAEKIEEEEL